MLILNDSFNRFELDILDYEFIHSKLDGWDSEWLRVSGRAECPKGKWKFIDSCVTTFELAALSSWLRNVAAQNSPNELCFTEPNIRFTHDGDAENRVLSIHLSQEASPPWATESERFGDGYALQVPFSSIGFADAVTAVEQLCKKFPERATRGRG